MGPYCQFCGRRCFVLRVLDDGRSMLLATCAKGMEHDRKMTGQDHTTAHNPAICSGEPHIADCPRYAGSTGGTG